MFWDLQLSHNSIKFVIKVDFKINVTEARKNKMKLIPFKKVVLKTNFLFSVQKMKMCDIIRQIGQTWFYGMKNELGTTEAERGFHFISSRNEKKLSHFVFTSNEGVEWTEEDNELNATKDKREKETNWSWKLVWVDLFTPNFSDLYNCMRKKKNPPYPFIGNKNPRQLRNSLNKT